VRTEGGSSKPSCPICNSYDLNYDGDYRSIHAVFNGIKRVECSSCSLVYAVPMPSKESVALYNAKYFDEAHGGRNHNRSSLSFFSGIAKIRLNHVINYLQKIGLTVFSILEFGPGLGYFARAWLRNFTQSQYFSVETDLECRRELKKIGIRDLSDEVDNESRLESFDLLIMSHVLEHVTEPVDFILTASSYLRPGGALFVEVPFRDYHYKSIDEPHLLFFNKISLEFLLDKTGYENIEISYFGPPVNEGIIQRFFRKFILNINYFLVNKDIYIPLLGLGNPKDCLMPMERMILFPYKVNKESKLPSWWIRAVATKKLVKKDYCSNKN
jgi:SAM-dependent methyltransferase